MKKHILNLALVALTVVVVALSVWGPEAMAKYRDRDMFDTVNVATEETEGSGYRYQLSPDDKLYILSRCLDSQDAPGTEQSALTREPDAAYQELAGSYAFIANRNDPSDSEITGEEIYEAANDGLARLKELGILPEEIRDVQAGAYDAALYSAIDVPEPRNNVAVWKLSLIGTPRNTDKENRLIDAYIDADDGKIYEFYVRSQLKWEDIDTDVLVEQWASYMGLTEPQEYENDNPLLETTPYYKKYVFEGMGEDRTVVTVGFYDGIQELFLKISK